MKDHSNSLDKLAVLWTTSEREVALKMVFMYIRNAQKNGWWDVVRLIVWGPSAELLANDEELKIYIGEMLENNIEIAACKACTDRYGVSEILAEIGIEVLFIGEPFTDMLKTDWKVLTI